MNKTWLYLVGLGVLATVLVIGWDVFASVTGFKTDFHFSINPMEDRLFGPVEDHLRNDPSFSQFQTTTTTEESDQTNTQETDN